jgi:hypothetical protein
MKMETPEIFRQTAVHPQFAVCLEQLHQVLSTPTSTRLLIVTGPTGAGKTTLRNCFTEEIAKISAPELEADPEMVAFGAFSVKAPGLTAFSWKDSYIQLLRSLQHPFAESRNLGIRGSAGLQANSLKSIGLEQTHRLTNDRLFRVLQRTIEHRRPRVIVLDEAHHLLRLASRQSIISQLEHLKYLADETKTLLVLFGTYELTRLLDLSGALIRRREVVHFPRYVFRSQEPHESLEGFAKAVAFYVPSLEESCEIDLLEEVPYLYQGSVGCVGVLRDWLFRAFQLSKLSAGRRITKQHLDRTVSAASDRRKLLKECQGGEEYFEARVQGEEKYLIELGFADMKDAPPPQAERPQRHENRPFKRKPHNDPVGTSHLDAAQRRVA